MVLRQTFLLFTSSFSHVFSRVGVCRCLSLPALSGLTGSLLVSVSIRRVPLVDFCRRSAIFLLDVVPQGGNQFRCLPGCVLFVLTLCLSLLCSPLLRGSTAAVIFAEFLQVGMGFCCHRVDVCLCLSSPLYWGCVEQWSSPCYFVQRVSCV